MALFTKFPFKAQRADGSVAVWIDTTNVVDLFEIPFVKENIGAIDWAGVRSISAACAEDLEWIA
jgi:hypothetical protein